MKPNRLVLLPALLIAAAQSALAAVPELSAASLTVSRGESWMLYEFFTFGNAAGGTVRLARQIASKTVALLFLYAVQQRRDRAGAGHTPDGRPCSSGTKMGNRFRSHPP